MSGGTLFFFGETIVSCAGDLGVTQGIHIWSAGNLSGLGPEVRLLGVGSVRARSGCPGGRRRGFPWRRLARAYGGGTERRI